MAFARLQLRGDTAANWAAADPILADREMALETDTSQFKVGDGATVWSGLPYGGIAGPEGPSGWVDFQGLPPAGPLQPGDVVPIQRGTGPGSTLHTTIADILANAGSGAQTGDLLLTVRAPEGNWLEQDAVYLQADYPELFGLVGLLPDAPPGRVWASATSPGTINGACRVTDQIAVAVGNNVVWRTTDGAVSWATIPVVGNLQAVAPLGNGVLLAVGTGGVILRSVDEGLTWAAVTSGTLSLLRRILVMSQNVVVVHGDGGAARRSTNGGLTFGAVTGSFSTNALHFSLRFSPLVAVIYPNTGAGYWRTVDAGLTWAPLTFPGNYGTGQQGAVFDANTAAIPGSNGNWMRSVNQGESWAISNIAGMPGNAQIIRVDGRRAVWPGGTGGAGDGYITNDAALTWANIGQLPARYGELLSNALMLAWGGTGVHRSSAEYAYDTATMFKTPTVGDVRGYIKP